MDAQEIALLVNAQRSLKGHQPLEWNKDLQTAAELKVEQMKEEDYFAHRNAKGETVSTLIPKEYRYYAVGENLAYGFTSEDDVIAAWMKSPTHKSNLLDSEYRDTAIGIGEVNGKFLVAQVFGVRQETYLSHLSAGRDVLSGTTQTVLQGVFYVSTMIFILVLLRLVTRKRKRAA